MSLRRFCLVTAVLLAALLALGGNAVCVGGGGGGGAPPPQIPKFPGPILVTCTGQTPGSLTLSQLMERLQIAHTHDSVIVPSKMQGFKTMVVVMGASLKGLGAAGLDQDEEMERCQIVFKKAKSLGMKIVAAHIEGTARRNAVADKFIEPFAVQGDFLLILQESNQDGLFTKMSEKNKIPMVVFKDFTELPPILTAMFK